jgi:hypothetical protein
MKINGVQGMTLEEVRHEVERGGRFVIYQYCISLLVITFRRPSDIYFVKGGHSRFAKGLSYAAITLVMGWWGIPWGPIFSITSLVTDFGGGKDVTQEVLASLQPASPPPIPRVG